MMNTLASSQYGNGLNVSMEALQAKTATARPDTEIEGCLSRANNALERLHGRISAVEDRVRPVMRSVGQSQQSNAGKSQEALSPLGDAITSIESRIDSAVDRLEALLLGMAL